MMSKSAPCGNCDEELSPQEMAEHEAQVEAMGHMY